MRTWMVVAWRNTDTFSIGITEYLDIVDALIFDSQACHKKKSFLSSKILFGLVLVGKKRSI